MQVKTTLVWLSLIIALVLGVAAFVLIGGTAPAQPSQAQAVDDVRSMAARLDTLKTPLANESGFLVTFEFKTFIADYNAAQAVPDARSGSSLTIPYRSPNGEVTLTLGEIGSDHVCFDERHGDQSLVRCVMFSDISSIVYPGA